MKYILDQAELDSFILNQKEMEKRVNELLDSRMLEFRNCVTILLHKASLNVNGHFDDPQMRSLIFCIKKAMRDCKITIKETPP